MLILEPSKRASIPEISSHSWIKKHTASFYANVSPKATPNISSHDTSFHNVPRSTVISPTDHHLGDTLTRNEDEKSLEKIEITESSQITSAQMTPMNAKDRPSSSSKNGKLFPKTPSNDVCNTLSNYFTADGEPIIGIFSLFYCWAAPLYL
jgi:hypothetical protein